MFQKEVIIYAFIGILCSSIIFATEATSSTCGYVNSDLTLTADIQVNGTCFTINASGVTLDGGGYEIRGNNSGVGIESSANTDVVVENFKDIQNFSKGIDLAGSDHNWVIVNNTFSKTEYPIEIGSSNFINITGNNIGFIRSGIYLTFSNSDATITQNNITGEPSSGLKRAIQIISSNRANVTNNNISISSTQAVGFYIVSSSPIRIVGNRVNLNYTDQQGIYLSGTDNSFIEYNTINITDHTSSRSPEGISFTGSDNNNYTSNHISTQGGSSSTSIEMTNGKNNFFINNQITAEGTDIIIKAGVGTYINSTFNTSDIEYTGAGTGNITVIWHVDVNTTSEQGDTVSNANVGITNALGDAVASKTTSAQGSAQFQLTEFTQTASTKIYHTPHIINATAPGYFINSTSLNITPEEDRVQTMIIPPLCGNNIWFDYTFEANVNSTGTCLTINASGVTINGGGYILEGNNTGYGITNVADIENITLKNFGAIKNFSRAAFFQDTNNLTVINNSIRDNTEYSVLIQRTDNTTIADNSVDSDRGIHITYSDYLVIENNNISTTNTGDSSVILSNSEYINVTSNNITCSGSTCRAISVIGTALNNRFTDNQLTSIGSIFAVVQDDIGTSTYIDNIINISGSSSGRGLQLGDNTNATNNLIYADNANADPYRIYGSDVIIEGGLISSPSIAIAINSGSVTLRNVSFDTSQVEFIGPQTGNMTVEWYVDLSTSNTTHQVNANITTTDAESNQLYSFTDINQTQIIVQEFTQNSSSITYHTPHTFSAQSQSYRSNTTTLNITQTNSTSFTIYMTPPGTLLPSFTSPSQSSNQAFDQILPLTSTVTCNQHMCGNITAYLFINDSIATNGSANSSTFFINDSSSQRCLNLQAGQSCNSTWYVNITNPFNTPLEFYVTYNESMNEVTQNQTQTINITGTDLESPTYTIIQFPTSSTTGESVQVIINATDNREVKNASINIDGIISNMTKTNNQYVHTISSQENSLTDITYNITILDEVGNSNSTTTTSIILTDNDGPVISNISITPQNGSIGTIFTIEINATDISNVSSVQMFIQRPDEITNETLLLTLESGVYNTTWNSSLVSSGAYIIDIQTNDSLSNTIEHENQAVISVGSSASRIVRRSFSAAQAQVNTTQSVININLNTSRNFQTNVIEHTTNPESQNAVGVLALNRYIQIIVDNTTNNNISSAYINMTYTDAEISAAGIDESTLRLYRFNTTLDEWVELSPGGVDTTQNYVWAQVSRFSSFGAFGSAPSSSSGGSSGGGGGGGSSGQRQYCSDGIDNDNDGLIDFPEDDDCDSIFDSQERPVCVEHWTCSRWTECKESLQHRTCQDINRCRSEFRKPNETQACVMPIIENETAEIIEELPTQVSPPQQIPHPAIKTTPMEYFLPVLTILLAIGIILSIVYRGQITHAIARQPPVRRFTSRIKRLYQKLTEPSPPYIPKHHMSVRHATSDKKPTYNPQTYQKHTHSAQHHTNTSHPNHQPRNNLPPHPTHTNKRPHNNPHSSTSHQNNPHEHSNTSHNKK